MKTHFFFDSFYLSVLDCSINGIVDSYYEHVFFKLSSDVYYLVPSEKELFPITSLGC